ncbi:hypothetical protein BD560DRAFT_401873 [Blakeslea trispora]|nr:hypothetical protein BD560DRAFT_401873 [Blakeslea trispora]
MFVCYLRLYFDSFWLFKLPIFKQSFNILFFWSVFFSSALRFLFPIFKRFSQ